MNKRTMTKEQIEGLFHAEKEHVVTAFNFMLGAFGGTRPKSLLGFDSDISKVEQYYAHLGQSIKLLKQIRESYAVAPKSSWTYEKVE